MSRLWDTLAPSWRACIEEAWGAYCAGSLPIGAVITDAAGTILVRARNRVRETVKRKNIVSDSRIAHAEINALAALSTHDAPGRLTLHCSTEPCPMCTGAIRISRIGEVRFASRDPFGGGIRLLRASPYMRAHRGIVRGPEHPGLETLFIALLVERLSGIIQPPLRETIIEAWVPVVPTAVRLGRLLHEQGILEPLAGQPVDAATLVHAIEDAYPAYLPENMQRPAG